MVGEHGPEAAQAIGGDARAELWDVALQIGLDEVLPPAQAARIAGREKTVGKAAPQPQLVPLGGRVADLEHGEGIERQVTDPPGQGLARLAEQLERGRAKQQV